MRQREYHLHYQELKTALAELTASEPLLPLLGKRTETRADAAHSWRVVMHQLLAAAQTRALVGQV